MDLVRAEVAAHLQETPVDRAAVGDIEARDEPFQKLLAGLGSRRELAKAVGLPVISVAPLGTAILPGRIVAHACHADEEVYVAHDLGEDQRRDAIEWERCMAI